jgi:integrase
VVRRRDESHIRRVFLPAFGEVPLAKLWASNVSEAFTAIDARYAEILAARASDDPEVRASVRGERTASAATKQRIRATLRSALSDAAAGDHPLIEGKRGQARPAPGREAAEGARLDGRQGEGMARGLAEARGLRRGEACGLRWADVDLERAVMTIRTQLVQNGWEVEEDEPKTDASDDTVSLDDPGAARTWHTAQEAERADWGGAWTGSGRVFTREDGADLHPANAITAFEWLCYEAGLPPIRLHDLRHGAASIARHAGADMAGIKKLMRHSSIVITIDTYTSVFEEADAELAEKMSDRAPARHRGRPVRY